MTLNRYAARTDAEYVVCVVLPFRIVSEANTYGHWRVKAARVKTHRTHAALILRHSAGVPPEPPLSITLTRIAPRELDSDNLASGFKATRDGIADWLGIDDGDKRLTWNYAQRKGKPKEYAAEVTISAVVRDAESAIRACRSVE